MKTRKRKDALVRRPGHPLQSPCPENLAGRERSLAGCSPWGHGESGTTERLILTYSRRGREPLVRGGEGKGLGRGLPGSFFPSKDFVLSFKIFLEQF